MLRFSYLFVFIFLLYLCQDARAQYAEYQAVKLDSVPQLTFHERQLTSGRRSEPVPQLTCTGGAAGCNPSRLPSMVECYNRGYGKDDNLKWECIATLDHDIRFGLTSINCEGYTYPTDPWVLEGSCALYYTLEYEKRILSDVPYLDFYKGSQTRGRRTAPIPALQCIGGSAGCDSFNIPDHVRCKNIGFRKDVQWQCEGDLPTNIEFGSTKVSCEGYQSPNDDYVLEGSCAFIFTLEGVAKTHTKEYEESRPHQTVYNVPPPVYSQTASDEGEGWFWIVFIIAVLGLMAIPFLISVFGAKKTQQRQAQSSDFKNTSNYAERQNNGYGSDFVDGSARADSRENISSDSTDNTSRDDDEETRRRTRTAVSTADTFRR